jgi:hypothetical protein
MELHMLTRREMLSTAGQAAAAAIVAGRVGAAQTAPRSAFCLFSKHLPELSWGDLGRAVKDTGFDGVDLTVRAAGHVLPERAAADLPKAIDAIKAHGLDVPMITTELTSAASPIAKPLLQTAARSGVRFFKAGYWRFSSSPDVRAQVAAAGEAMAGLAALARDCGIEMGIHNHASYIGAALWDIAPAIDKLDSKSAGYYFDPRHAAAEDDRAQGFLLDQDRERLADSGLSARRRHGGLDLVRQHPAQRAFHRADLDSPRVRHSRRDRCGTHPADLRRRETRSRGRPTVPE